MDGVRVTGWGTSKLNSFPAILDKSDSPSPMGGDRALSCAWLSEIRTF